MGKIQFVYGKWKCATFCEYYYFETKAAPPDIAHGKTRHFFHVNATNASFNVSLRTAPTQENRG